MNYIKSIWKLTGFLCAIAMGTGCSEPNALEQLCEATGGTYQDNRCVCDGEICDTNMVCTESGKCPVVLSSMCDPGEIKCSGNAVYACVKDIGWSQDEKCDKGCADDGKKCAQCHESSCKDDILTQCNDNIATTIPCKHGCNAEGNDCKPECESGQVKCDGKTRLECNPDSLTWRSVETCETACDLDSSSNTRCIDDCEDGATRCTDGKLSTCIDKIWSTPVTCEFNGMCANEQRCVECDETSETDKKRCVNDAKGVGHMMICKGQLYEDELVPQDPENPESPLIPHVSPEGYSCKQGENDFGECNNLNKKFCEDKVNADLQGHDLGIIYSCEGGLKVETSKCWDPDDYTTKVSCNADKTDCGTCINNLSAGCANDEHGVGTQKKCVSGAYQEVKCGRNLACSNDKYCKQCIYNANMRDNDTLCFSGRNNQLLVCQPDGTWNTSPKTCMEDPQNPQLSNKCQKYGEYRDYCPGGY